MSELINKELLVDSINYQNGSIVSKQILKKPNGNITLFAFDKEESLTGIACNDSFIDANSSLPVATDIFISKSQEIAIILLREFVIITKPDVQIE